MCGFFGITDKTLERWCKRTYHAGFSEVFSQKRGMGKISLRRAQFKLAQKSANMAIWLGKQWLGQRDKAEAFSEEIEDDGFLSALSSSASSDWENVKEEDVEHTDEETQDDI